MATFTETLAKLDRERADLLRSIRPDNGHCAACGEQWPCTVYTGRSRYRPEVSIGHVRK